jgi:hypothetical protein
VPDQSAAHIALQFMSATSDEKASILNITPLEYRWVRCRSIVTCSRLPAAIHSVLSIKRESAGATKVSAIIFIISAR